MPDAVAIAQARITALKAKIRKLEVFIETYNEVLAMDSPSDGLGDGAANSLLAEGNNTSSQPVENGGKSRSRRQTRRSSGIRPSEVAAHMERIIREVGRPMTRGEIVEAFERRDIRIPYEDKARYIGTIAWRHKGVFKNIEGRGYWIKDEQLPSEAHNPTFVSDSPDESDVMG